MATVNANTQGLVITEQAANISFDISITSTKQSLGISEKAALVSLGGAATSVINTNYDSKRLYFNGTNYFTF